VRAGADGDHTSTLNERRSLASIIMRAVMSRATTDVFGIMLERLDSGRPLALATVVTTSGSVYRRAGARMLIEPGGQAIGSVSGGCLEADLQERALRFAAEPAPQVIEYDGLAADGMPWGLGLGCNGRVSVVLQMLRPQDCEWARLLCAARAGRRAAALATVFGGRIQAAGATLAIDAQGMAAPTDLAPALGAALRAELHSVLASGHTRIAPALGAIDCVVLLEFLPPPIRLVIVGGGSDAVPLAAAARAQGWDIVVTDHRATQLAADRFPGAELLATELEASLPLMRMDARTAVVVMTHNYERDRRALAALAVVPPAYLGALGPRARTERVLQELQAGGAQLAGLRRVLHAPVGLALGGETPEEIAVSIIAEIIARFRGGPGGSLRDSAEPIHAPP
jgi:xanthine dehydrogenase accessory factor